MARVQRKPMDEMTEPELQAMMTNAGRAVEHALGAYIPGERPLFALLVWNDPRVAQYMSTAERDGVIQALREAADRLEYRSGGLVERVPFPDRARFLEAAAVPVDQMPDKVPGEHLWVAMGAFRVEPGEDAHRYELSAGNVLSVQGPGCFWCERLWGPATAAAPCPGHPTQEGGQPR